jgi:hypothetical protein
MDVLARPNDGSDRVKMRNERTKKTATNFGGCFFYGREVSAERREARPTEAAERNKGSDQRETA